MKYLAVYVFVALAVISGAYLMNKPKTITKCVWWYCQTTTVK